MEEKLQFAIGFVAGRANTCNIINAYYTDMLEQVSRYNRKVDITIYILIDTHYLNTPIEDFYKLNKEVLESEINIRYITPEDLENEKNKLINEEKLSKEEANLFLGYGHARCRNTIMYYATKEKKDVLLFWDDDEYPVANIKQKDGSMMWKKQDNILVHLREIENADITIGYHCGYISPIPYLHYYNEISDEDFQNFIEAVSNDILSWESIKEKFELHDGFTYADENLANEIGTHEIEEHEGGKWVAGSTLCINLRSIDKIPAFYNPVGARGEDTFFSTKLKDTKVVKVPVYHFHDGFMKYESIMKGIMPTDLTKIVAQERKTGIRFLNASIGWVRYKPLFTYITKPENYKERLEIAKNKLETSSKKMDKAFKEIDFTILIDEFAKYNANIEKDYADYVRNNEIWNKCKKINL